MKKFITVLLMVVTMFSMLSLATACNSDKESTGGSEDSGFEDVI